MGSWTIWYSTSQTGDYVAKEERYRTCEKEIEWFADDKDDEWTKTGNTRYTEWSSWSSWSSEKVTENENRDVEEKTSNNVTEYRYRERQLEYEYYRWGNWAIWQTGDAPSATSSLQVEKEYRYQKKDYYWTDYSKWQDDKVTKDDKTKVKTRTVYSYRKKLE